MKEENEELKQKISKLEKQKPKVQTIKQDTSIIDEIKKEGKIEQELIIKNLESIKQLTKTGISPPPCEKGNFGFGLISHMDGAQSNWVIETAI